MGHGARKQDYEWLRLPRELVRFPIELRLPSGFRPEEAWTWPPAQGRLELVGGRLLYMPPCGGVQQEVAIDVSFVLVQWSRTHPGFGVGGNEAGMLLHDDVRAADAAVWRRAEVGAATTELRRVPPLLAVEVAGQDEDEQTLRAKAQ